MIEPGLKRLFSEAQLSGEILRHDEVFVHGVSFPGARTIWVQQGLARYGKVLPILHEELPRSMASSLNVRNFL